MSRTPATEQIPEIIHTVPTTPWVQRIRDFATSRSLAPYLLVMILLIAAAFRLTGVNWDSGKRLHPDERFLTSVATDIKWPSNVDTYFDPQASPLSPYTLPNMGLWVYGTLPLWLVKGVAIILNQDSYDSIAIVGRMLSAIFDIAAIWVLFNPWDISARISRSRSVRSCPGAGGWVIPWISASAASGPSVRFPLQAA